MAVRWASDGFFVGYGVWGENVIPTTPLKVVDVRLLTQEIPKLSIGTSDDDPYQVLILTVRWRFTLRLFSANDANITSLFNPLGKRKLGRYDVQAYEYVSYSDFWSTDLYVSPRFTFRSRYVNNELPELDLPCNEPQLDLPDLFTTNGTFFPWSGYYSVYQNFYDQIGDSVTIWTDGNINAYGLGITYDWDWEGWNGERIDTEGGIPNIYIL